MNGVTLKKLCREYELGLEAIDRFLNIVYRAYFFSTPCLWSSFNLGCINVIVVFFPVHQSTWKNDVLIMNAH